MVTGVPVFTEAPKPWQAENGVVCWSNVPLVTNGVPLDEFEGAVLTDCDWGFNLLGGQTYRASWVFGSFQMDSGLFAAEILFDPIQSMLYNWARPDGVPTHAGVLLWGPSKDVLTSVVYYYADGSTSSCSGPSFEVARSRMDVELYNPGDIGAVFRLGVWGVDTQRGVNPPVCQPDHTKALLPPSP